MRRLVRASLLEALGDTTSRTVLPLLAVSVLGAGTGFVGVLNALGLVAFLVFGAPPGAAADRWQPARLMVASTLARAAMATFGLVAWTCGLLGGPADKAVLLCMAVIIGVSDVAYATARGSLIPRLVEADGVRAAFGRVQTASQAGGLVAPVVLAAMLVAAPTPAAWGLAIVAYLSSALAQRAIPAAPVGTNPRSTDAHAATHVAPVAAGANPPATGTPGATLWRAARTDLMGQPVLRTVTLANAFANSAAMAANTLLPVVALTTLGLPPASYALLGTVGAIAGIAGAATASRMTARLGLRATRSQGAACLVAGAATVAVLTTGTLPGSALLWLSAQSALAAIGISLMMISGSDLPARLVPPERLGAATGAQQAVVVGVMPLAALGFGALGSASPAAATVAWALCAAAALTLSLALPRAGQESRG